ncbi:MAG: RHS repeat-associated core domain-containing protein [Pseudobdellovibrio sp.]
MHVRFSLGNSLESQLDFNRSDFFKYEESGRVSHYDSTVGRFTTKDPKGFAGGDANLYSYVGANPMSYTDPTGHCPMCLVPVATGVAGGIGSAVGTLIGGGSFADARNSFTGGFLAGGLAGLTAITGGVLY